MGIVMKCFRIALAVLLACVAGAALPSTRQVGDSTADLSVPRLGPDYRVLANGAKLYALRDPTVSTVQIDVWYGVGYRDDPVGRSGFAHLFEHLMFKQTRNLPEAVKEFILQRGGAANASTLFDYTVYTNTAPANELQAMLWLEGERLKNLVIDQKNLDSERGVVEEELRQRIQSDPYGRILYSLVPAYSFEDHPYARPIGGSFPDLDSATLADVRSFHEAYYRPDNAIFVVVGNFDLAKLDRWADSYIGTIPRPTMPIPRVDKKMKPLDAPVAVDAYAPNVPLPAVVFDWHSPPASDPHDIAALALIEAILTRGPSSRLNRVLVHDRQLATRIVDYNFRTEDGFAFALVATLAKDVSIGEGAAALSRQIADLRNHPVSAAELRVAKNGLLGDALTARETVDGRAYDIGEGAFLTGNAGAADEQLAKIQAMTAADVQACARKWLSDQQRVTIRYRDDSERPAGYEPPPGADTSRLGTHVPPASGKPIAIAPASERVTPPPPGKKAQRVIPPVVERGLANGLRVIAVKSSEIPLTTLALSIPVGEGSDPPAQAGLADMTAALLLRGTTTLGPDAIDARITILGGSVSADAQADATAVKITVPSVNAEAAAKLLADMVLHPAFAGKEVEKERKQQIDALAIANREPLRMALRVLPGIVFAGTHYDGVPTSKSLAAITRQDIVAGWRSAARPEGATLVVTGALSPRQGVALVDRVFGTWQSNHGVASSAQKVANAGPPRPQVVAIDLPGAAQTAVMGLIPVPGRRALDYPALERASIMAGKWLSDEIRVKRGLTYGASTLLMLHRDAGAVLAATRTKNQSALEVARLIDAQLARLQREAPTSSQVAESETLLGISVGRKTDTSAGLADYLLSYASVGVPLSDAEAELHGGHDVSIDRVHRAGELLGPDRASLLLVGDSRQWLDQL
ncbi:MAG TPA: pitrilysin family protein, partial [Rhodanobacteraceae bacterium]|nr:pitrilysin family protein [Rhodanobacteraceae bacterium]